MVSVQRIGMIVAMTALAGGSGYYMQNKHGNGALSQGPVPESITPTAAGSPAAQDTALGGSAASEPPAALPEQQILAAGSAFTLPPLSDTAEQLAVVTLKPEEAALETNVEPAKSCSADMALIAQPGAMLDLGLLAPCHQNARILIRHGGLVITGLTSSAGTYVASIPALASPAEVSITFQDATAATESVVVPDLAAYDKFGVQWMANDAFQIHAYQNGATFGEDGHISAANPARVTAEGGFVTLLGDDRADRPLLAEIYTYPAKVRASDSAVIVSVEAAVTEGTCGREILGETLQLSEGKVVLRDLTIEMPDCTAVGEYMVLDQPVLLASR